MEYFETFFKSIADKPGLFLSTYLTVSLGDMLITKILSLKDKGLSNERTTITTNLMKIIGDIISLSGPTAIIYTGYHLYTNKVLPENPVILATATAGVSTFLSTTFGSCLGLRRSDNTNYNMNNDPEN